MASKRAFSYINQSIFVYFRHDKTQACDKEIIAKTNNKQIILTLMLVACLIDIFVQHFGYKVTVRQVCRVCR